MSIQFLFMRANTNILTIDVSIPLLPMILHKKYTPRILNKKSAKEKEELGNYFFHWQIKYSSKLRSLHACGLNRESLEYFLLTGAIRSSISSPTKTFRMTVPHFTRNSSATSRIAILSSIDLY